MCWTRCCCCSTRRCRGRESAARERLTEVLAERARRGEDRDGPAAGRCGFQQALHLDIPSVTVDGIVGPVTWQALVSGMLSF